MAILLALAVVFLALSAYLLLRLLIQLRALTRTVITLYNGAVVGTDKPKAHVRAVSR